MVHVWRSASSRAVVRVLAAARPRASGALVADATITLVAAMAAIIARVCRWSEGGLVSGGLGWVIRGDVSGRWSWEGSGRWSGRRSWEARWCQCWCKRRAWVDAHASYRVPMTRNANTLPISHSRARWCLHTAVWTTNAVAIRCMPVLLRMQQKQGVKVC